MLHRFTTLHKMILIMGISFFVGPNISFSQECQQMSVLWNLVHSYHVQPKPLDDSLSKSLFRDLFENLDPHGMYFVQTDMQGFEKYKFALDEAIQNGDCDFITDIAGVYEKRLIEADTV